MIIANPIYDVVFKYLLEDTEIARELLSTILDVHIAKLEVKPQETLIKGDDGEIKIFHLDFKAVIDLEGGAQKKVLIELQKARKSYDISRFRKYLGKNYMKEEVRKNEKNELESYSLEIVSVYILGFKLKDVDVPVLKVGRKYTNAITKQEVVVKHEFINNLTHESYTIQIPRLELNQQSELEQVLEIFSQDNVVSDNIHNLKIEKDYTNPLVKKIIRRLSKAAASEAIRRKMDAEDMIERLISRETTEQLKEQAEKHGQELVAKDEVIFQKEKLIKKEKAEKEKVEKEKEMYKKMFEDLQKQIDSKK